ncbi:hypothetical protein L484_006498 [Morus notabilis]|uniref:PAR1 protein n=1 Tax=Morus notabilis TaxID=981085 RepID=W9RZA9_9ROSA|nr:hypothetical protein L484_006498 [Morus notabilis]
MASKFCLKALALIALALCVQGTLGGITCEKLDQDTCAFAVSSSGKRCVLEKHVKRSGKEAYTCRASDIEADKLKDVIESDECIKACGLDRRTLGISSDSLLESRFTRQLCSPNCYDACHNVVDLYFNLAAGEVRTLGISSDSLLESRFTRQLCSPNCYDACHNVVDLYFNLAAGEGVFLPKLCEAQAGNVRREMAELRSSGFVVAPGPLHPAKLEVAPAISPAFPPF